jgi:hypothetical protein
MSIHVNNLGTYVPAKKIFVRQAGVWEQVKRVYVKQAGVWELAYINEYAITISANVLNPNITTLLTAQGWDETSPISVNITINSGVYIGSSTAAAALVIPALPSGSTVTLINNGFILGKGGNGGAGGINGGAGGIGANGGPAIQLGMDITIDNTNGIIGGGGKGGNGTASYSSTTSATGPCGGVTTIYYGGNGGGGGAGSSPGAGGNRGYWNPNYGQFGSAGTVSAGGAPNGGALGNGKAVDLLTYSVTWTAGNNATQVKGAVS